MTTNVTRTRESRRFCGAKCIRNDFKRTENLLDDFNSLSDMPWTGKLPGLGRFRNIGLVLATNLNSLESTSVR